MLRKFPDLARYQSLILFLLAIYDLLRDPNFADQDGHRCSHLGLLGKRL